MNHLQDELQGVALYRGLSDAESNPKIAEVYRRLAAVEQRHADEWVAQLKTAGVTPPQFQLAWRTRTLIWMAKRFGVATVLPSVASLEQMTRTDTAVKAVPRQWQGTDVRMLDS